ISDEDEIAPSDLMLHQGTAIAPWIERLKAAPPEATETPDRPSAPQPEAPAAGTEGPPASTAAPPSFGEGDAILSIEELKRQAVERAYHLCEGNVDKAAVELGIGRATMYRMLKKYGIMN